ncbi:hypothetical protein FRC03_002772 [Tulasnella sp. 419]|nr:hypothetical protein FRC03_002772 [Tulasnella sp. 419]
MDDVSHLSMRQSSLPVELIGRIIQLYDSIPDRNPKVEPLRDLALVSPIFRAETERILYSELVLTRLPRVVKCFKTILARPHLARHVRSLSISLYLDSSAPFDLWHIFGLQMHSEATENYRRRTGIVLDGFAKLVHRALMSLVNLKDYTLSLGGKGGRDEYTYSPCWLPKHAPFELRRFTVDLNASTLIVDFLANQPSITDLLAPHFTHDRFPLPLPPPNSRTALANKSLVLPRLNGVVAPPQVVASLVPKRPVWKVCMKDRGFQPRHAGLVDSIPALRSSSTPVKFFDTRVSSMTSAIDTIMGPLAIGAPDLQGLTLRRVTITTEKPYEIYTSDAFCEKLAQFQKLKHVTLPAPTSISHLGNPDNDMISLLGNLAAPIAFEAHINAQIVIDPPLPAGGQPGPVNIPLPPSPPPPAPVVLGPPLPPNFVNQNPHPPQPANHPLPPLLQQPAHPNPAAFTAALQQMLATIATAVVPAGPAPAPAPPSQQATMPAPTNPPNPPLPNHPLNFLFQFPPGNGPPPAAPANNDPLPPLFDPPMPELEDPDGDFDMGNLDLPIPVPAGPEPLLPNPPMFGGILHNILGNPNLTVNQPDPFDAPLPIPPPPPLEGAPLPGWNAMVTCE